MPEIFINGQSVQAEATQTVMQAATAHGFAIPHFCWHPKLSVPGNCRLCMVEVEAEGGAWLDIACNLPVSPGLRVRTDSEKVRARRQEILQLTLLNHPVDCGICDKAGECTLQDYHVEYNGAPSVSRDAKVHATKFFPLSERIVLDNERCILCSRCVRFTHEISKSHGLGIQQRGDHSLVRPVESGAFEADAYSDNVVDICPVGALLSRPFLHQARVWYLQATPSVCPGCERGCNVQVWHRKSEWQLHHVATHHNQRIERVTPLDNPAVNGPWICNKGRDLGHIFERARADQPMLHGKGVELHKAMASARALIGAAERPAALLSSWASNEELAAFHGALGSRMRCFLKSDQRPAAGELLEDDLLIRPDKNPNRAGALALFPDLPDVARLALPADTDLLLVWGEGFDFATLPPHAKVIFANAWQQPENDHADVFIPISVQTERHGHYTNFQGTVSAFAPCFARKPGVIDAEALFADLVPLTGAQA